MTCFDQGVAIFRVGMPQAPPSCTETVRSTLTLLLGTECSSWFRGVKIASVQLEGAVAHFITQSGIAIGASLARGVILWRTPPMFAGITNSVLVGDRLLAGGNNGIVTLDIGKLRLCGTCVTHTEHAPSSILDFVLAEYLPPALFSVGVLVMLVEALQMMRFATSPATPPVRGQSAARTHVLRASCCR